MKILSLSSVYPNPEEPGLGLFVRARLEEMARLAELKVIAPIPLIDYSNPKHRVYRRRTLQAARQDGAIEVFHPRWLYPPRGTPVNVPCQFLGLLPVVHAIHRSFPFELIDAHFGYPEGATAALLAAVFRCPFSVTFRGNEIKFAQYRMRRPVIRWVLRRAAKVITVSEELRRFAIALGADPAKVKTIPNGIDPDLFSPQDREACRRKFQMPNGSAPLSAWANWSHARAITWLCGRFAGLGLKASTLTSRSPARPAAMAPPMSRSSAAWPPNWA